MLDRLLSLADSLNMPTLIVWCEQDRIFHVRGAHELDARLADSRLAILEQCRHVPMLDMPVEVARTMQDFIRHHGGSDKDR